MASTHTDFGTFLKHYRALKRADLLDTTPLILSEGDSWFSTPLYYNLVDWLETEAHHALFMRLEASGDLATRMFRGGNLKVLESRLKNLEFDVLLISAGGNDFVDDYLQRLFENAKRMTPEQALARVIASGRYDDVLKAYRRGLEIAFAARPNLQVITHTYDYPRLMGQAAKLSVEAIGLVALFKRSVGDWIARHIRHVLPSEDEQRAFVKLLIDEFSNRVLSVLKNEYDSALTIVEFRGNLTSDADWNDEMHPTGAAFRTLAADLRAAVRSVLPAAKRAGIG
jgi:hypothetical protein